MGNLCSDPGEIEKEKSTKELLSEMKKNINRLLREYSREKIKINIENDKIKKNIIKNIKNNEQSSKTLAIKYLKNTNYFIKYDNLIAKLKGIKIQLQTISTTNMIINTFKDLNNILGKTVNSIDITNYERMINDFNTQMEESENIKELIAESINDNGNNDDDGDDTTNDIKINNLINKIEDDFNYKNKIKLNNTKSNFNEELNKLRID